MAIETTINGLVAASSANTTDLTEVEQSIGGGNYTSRKVTESQRISLYNTSLQLGATSQVTGLTAALAACLQVTSNLSDLNSVPTARTNLGLAIASDVQFATLTLGTTHTTDRILGVSGDIRQTASNNGVVVNTLLGATSGTVATSYAVNISPNFSSNAGTVTSGAGLFIGTGSTAGTVTVGYSLLVSNPSFGSTQICASFFGAIQVQINVTGAKICTLGTNAPNVINTTTPFTWVPWVAADNSTCYFPIFK